MKRALPDATAWAVSFAGIATAVLDGEGTVLGWSQAAAELLGRRAEEVCGRPVRTLFADASDRAWGAAPWRAGMPAGGRARLRHRSGGSVDVTLRALPLECAESLLLFAPTQRVTDWERGASVLRVLVDQDRVGVVVHDSDMTVVRTSITPQIFGGSAQALKHLLADRSVQLDAAWLLVQWAAQGLDPSTLPGPTPQRPPGPC